ncbi:UBA/TS-N domain containing protein [Trichomonas vaginalis G3]|uniref:UV excision repair protein RAD23 n=1 Tax=Trichomonas vaginalis (strain ATCC PRA-98 / G3) TaxID=412133 RepID=A2DSP6_TRIV3|nr:UV excision repair protein RAD23 family [Trichomonas vaginalis G3]EAY16626.1 UBA/TS-N domain containing protein [Trichomonas vaginalis G3]KAI5533003.1 UV excision repair protein RAD23 family [Trichomonas vaginalis G3]|eukprot:XP_001328849.1 UBA/TS-N domain containing protein [Trichomonas vaginalis G3]
MGQRNWLLFEYASKKYFIEVDINDTFGKFKQIVENKIGTRLPENIAFIKQGGDDKYEDMTQTFKDAGITEMSTLTITNSASAPTRTKSVSAKPAPAQPAPQKTEPVKAQPIKPAQPAPAPQPVPQPAPARPAPQPAPQPARSDLSDQIQQISQVTGETDHSKIEALLRQNNESVEAVVNAILDERSQTNVVTQTSQYSNAVQEQFNQFTQAEKDAIERLKSNGFSFSQCVEMFVACDKNEELALSLLLTG